MGRRKNEATFERGNDILVLCCRKRGIYDKRRAKQMDTVAVNVEGRVIVPVRYVRRPLAQGWSGMTP